MLENIIVMNGQKSGIVRFQKKTMESPSVKKKANFFDVDNDSIDDFELFTDDKDFKKMVAGSKLKNEDAEPQEVLGPAWGGKAYSIEENKPSTPAKVPTVDHSGSKTSFQRQSDSDLLRPFEMRDKMTSTSRTKFTETLVQTSRIKTEEAVINTVQSTRFQATGSNSIENVVQKTKSEMTDAERNRMKSEIKELQKTVSSLRQQNKKAPLPNETVRKLMLNQPCVLELYKSLEGKISLLDEAIKLGDGDAIITVLLFLKRTVKPSIFVREIKKHPIAVNHMISFMKAHYDYDELIKLLRHLDRKEEAMILEYKRAMTSSSNADSQINAINSCQRNYETTPALADMVSVLNEHQALLKRQIKIEIKDKRSQAEGKDQTMRFHPRKSITSSPLIETLHYCCFYHYGKTDEIIGPASIQKDFKLTEKQYEWTMIVARAALKKWGDLDTIFTSKNWYGSNKQKSSLGFDKVVRILEKNGAPPDILSKYLTLIDIPETRLVLATKLQCHKVAVETIVSMKDKQKLEEYRRLLERTHPVQSIISNHLQNSQIKWR